MLRSGEESRNRMATRKGKFRTNSQLHYPIQYYLCSGQYFKLSLIKMHFTMLTFLFIFLNFCQFSCMPPLFNRIRGLIFQQTSHTISENMKWSCRLTVTTHSVFLHETKSGWVSPVSTRVTFAGPWRIFRRKIQKTWLVKATSRITWSSTGRWVLQTLGITRKKFKRKISICKKYNYFVSCNVKAFIKCRERSFNFQ